ncbi:stage III sporulation protein AE [Feifania hominis]|uniref:Stage III sporulation protein AE n=1 Tax=Feifania hominis TaxID=2763660 RepID=A0A926DCZ6_9FIRM|nr:stage III sporulation protein AE [Feifania hominis]MBC8535539.1 stage III sporulation protein AE [Feifania hominis]
MKQAFRFLAAAVVLMLLCSLTAHAVDVNEIYSDVADRFGVSELIDAAPDAARGSLSGEQVSPSGLLNLLSMNNVLNLLTNGLFGVLGECLSGCAVLLVAVLVFLLLAGLRDSFHSSAIVPTFNLVAVLTISLVVYGIISGAYSAAFTATKDITAFISTLMPVMAATMAAGGEVVSVGILPPAILTAINLLSWLNTSVFLPTLNFYFALSFISAVNPRLNLKELMNFIKKALMWGMGIATTILVGLLSLQKMITGASDNITGRAAKFALSSFVPIIGGVLKDAFDTVAGCVSVIKATCGVFGIVVIIYTMLPILARVILYNVGFRLSSSVAQISGQSSVSNFLDSVSNIWSILTAILVSEGVFAIVSVAVVISTGGGT